jgi:hypothetical protein
VRSPHLGSNHIKLLGFDDGRDRKGHVRPAPIFALAPTPLWPAGVSSAGSPHASD